MLVRTYTVPVSTKAPAEKMLVSTIGVRDVWRHSVFQVVDHNHIAAFTGLRHAGTTFTGLLPILGTSHKL